jgi:hypothetical protein
VSAPITSTATVGLYRYYGSREELLRQGCERSSAGSAPPLGTDAPEGALLVFLRCWTVLYGAVAMEIFGHLGFALDDPAPMFEFTLADLGRLVGLEYPPPGG